MAEAEWSARAREWFPELADTRLRQVTWLEIAKHHDYVVAQLKAGVTVSTVHQRLVDERARAVSATSLRRYVRANVADEAPPFAGYRSAGPRLPGSAEDIAAAVAARDAASLPERTRGLAFGDVAAVWEMLTRLDVVGLVDEVVGARRSDAGASVGTYLALAGLNRLVAPARRQPSPRGGRPPRRTGSRRSLPHGCRTTETEPGEIGRLIAAQHLRVCEELRPDPVELGQRLADLVRSAEVDSFLDAPDGYADVLGADGIAAFVARRGY